MLMLSCTGTTREARTETVEKEVLVVRKEANPEYVCVIPDNELRERLTPLQFEVTRTGGTELPFENEYWNNHEAGLYLDVIDGTPLFASTAKYDSGTGWPSFWEPLDRAALDLIQDTSYGMVRIEVRSKSSGAHLGHLFDDGPEPTGYRYCMNSASLRFVPASRLEAEGLSAYKKLFG
jgi:methionine-R-sulfoxide reductase